MDRMSVPNEQRTTNNNQCIRFPEGRVEMTNQTAEQFLQSRIQSYLLSGGNNYEFEVDSNGMLLMPWKSTHADKSTTVMFVGVFRTVLDPSKVSFAILKKNYNETIPELLFTGWRESTRQIDALINEELVAWKQIVSKKLLSDFRFGNDIQMALVAYQMLYDYRHNNQLRNRRSYDAIGADDTDEQYYKDMRDTIEQRFKKKNLRKDGGGKIEVCVDSLVQYAKELNNAIKGMSDKNPSTKISPAEFLSKVIPEDNIGDDLIDRMMCAENIKDHDTYITHLGNVTQMLFNMYYSEWSGSLGAILERVSRRIKRLETTDNPTNGKTKSVEKNNGKTKRK